MIVQGWGQRVGSKRRSNPARSLGAALGAALCGALGTSTLADLPRCATSESQRCLHALAQSQSDKAATATLPAASQVCIRAKAPSTLAGNSVLPETATILSEAHSGVLGALAEPQSPRPANS
jgi:hypothetical protein